MQCDFKQNVVVLIPGYNLDFTRKLKQILIQKLIKHSFQKIFLRNFGKEWKKDESEI